MYFDCRFLCIFFFFILISKFQGNKVLVTKIPQNTNQPANQKEPKLILRMERNTGLCDPFSPL